MLRFLFKPRMVALTMVLSAFALGVGSSSALAAFPGKNGLLAVQPLSGTGLILVGSNGAGEHRICTGVAACGYPSRPQWSPNGKMVTFFASSPGRPPEAKDQDGSVGVVAVNGTDVTGLLDATASAAPSFESNGSDISFLFHGITPGIASSSILGLTPIEPAPDNIRSSTLTAAVWSANHRLAVADGGKIVIESSAGKQRVLGAGSSPSWSPTGARLAIARGGWVWVISADMGRGHRLVRGSAPAFSPDGRWVAFIGPADDVETIPADGGRARQAGSVKGSSLDWQPLPIKTPACPMPTGGTRLLNSTSVEVDGFPQENDHGFDGELVSCLTSQGYPRVLSSDAYGVAAEGTSTPSAVISAGDFVAVLTDGSTTATGPSINLTQIDEYNAASGATVTGDMPPQGCGAMTDTDLSPAVSCGLSDPVLSSAGDLVYLDTEPQYPGCAGDAGGDDAAPDPTSCWTQQIIERTPGGTSSVLDSESTPAPDGQTGITGLSLHGKTLSWDDNGTQRTASLE